MVSIRQELKEYGLFPRKKFGQHFLIDQNILSKVIRTAQVEKEDVVLEVGPGLGKMTLALAKLAKRVIAVEIDAQLAEILESKAQVFSNVEIHRMDILEADLDRLIGLTSRPVKVVANLPYQISTPLLFRFIDSKEKFSTLTLMIQKEVAERLVALPGGKEFGPLSIFIQRVALVSIQFLVKPSSFFPSPKVDSAVIQIKWRKKPLVELTDEVWFKKVVRACFNYRRKTLANGLRHSGIPFPKEMEPRIKEIGIDPQRRPETLTLKEFAALAEILREQNKSFEKRP